MMLTAAKRRLSSSPAIRSWRDACGFARQATSPEGIEDSLNTLEHGKGPGG
jgi:hypothetical protein